MTGERLLGAILRFINGGEPERCGECGQETCAPRQDRFTEQDLCRDCMDAALDRAEQMYPPWPYWKEVRNDAE